MVRENIRYAEESVPQSASCLMSGDGQEVPPRECPVCHRETLVRKYSPKTKKHFWVCKEDSCVHPATGKPMFYADLRQKPVIKLCPQCGLPLNNVYSKKTKQSYWFCPKCNEFKNVKWVMPTIWVIRIISVIRTIQGLSTNFSFSYGTFKLNSAGAAWVGRSCFYVLCTDFCSGN